MLGVIMVEISHPPNRWVRDDGEGAVGSRWRGVTRLRFLRKWVGLSRIGGSVLSNILGQLGQLDLSAFGGY